MVLFNKIAIIGVGLIGGSLGLKIKEEKLASLVIGIGHHEKSIQEALRLRAIDDGSLNLAGVKDADLVILATPVGAILRLLPKVSRFIKKDCIVIDVGSTKGQIINLARGLGIEFIGCHPLAGMEYRGVKSAKSNLFEGSLCIITPLEKTDKKALVKIKRFWEDTGARTKLLSAGQHDHILSLVSHLPHAAAFSLINCIRSDYLGFGAGSLRDMTRIALSDSCLWRDIFLSNKQELLKAIEQFKGSLSRLESFIKGSQPKELESFLRKSQHKRNEF